MKKLLVLAVLLGGCAEEPTVMPYHIKPYSEVKKEREDRDAEYKDYRDSTTPEQRITDMGWERCRRMYSNDLNYSYDEACVAATRIWGHPTGRMPWDYMDHYHGN